MTVPPSFLHGDPLRQLELDLHPAALRFDQPLLPHPGHLPAEGGGIGVEVLGQVLLAEGDLFIAVILLGQYVELHQDPSPEPRLGQNPIFQT